ncbi:hypothetical protein HYPSUDRAFT_215866 [Hypholoma sublateritium FD-334 SS-4]|uniref:Ketoreductase (KR) domain-containing protein n=1 Tax=Hypholoma sublateritium (strain FD-334 SS-4) TaxID=945553 RepID=A0A0D2MFB3_HYPSF|nr:hypothetical protein HYPSUDRAFT_215866 [Hypholoma sublateritium FD-334 SS-4]
MSTVYLVTGSNRGIGLGLVAHILEKHDDAFVYAGVRNPGQASDLRALQIRYSSRMAIVECVSADVEGNAGLAGEIEKRHGRVDTVVANAAICNSSDTVSEISAADIEEHFHVNVTGTVVLFQAMYGLLRKSASPRFVPISTSAACLDGNAIKFPTGSVAYGATKAALNWATRKIHFENEWLVVFPLSPGPVDTDMRRTMLASVASGTSQKRRKATENPPTAEIVSVALVKLIDESTRDKDGGQFVHIDGTQLSW